VTLPPCVDCAKLIAAAGIRRVFFWGTISPDGTWRDDCAIAETIFKEAGIRLINKKEVAYNE
jgi:deoxycytidylate deaminase